MIWTWNYKPVGIMDEYSAYGAGGQGLDSWAGQIERSVANGSPPLTFFEAVLSKRLAVEMGPATCYALRRNTASIMKI